MIKTSVIVVAYNCAIDEIPCLKSTLASPSVGQVIVCDNSTEQNCNAERAEELGITYLPMEGNVGLPKAYNAGVEECGEEILCIFDDDTRVGTDYFDAVAELSNSSRKWDIALPLVMDGSDILSPCIFKGYRARPFLNSAQIKSSDNLSGINSGMVIKREVFSTIQYDERLFLDFVDHRFLQDARNLGMSIVYLDGPVLQQDYALSSDSPDTASRRLCIFEKDAKVFYEDSMPRRLYCNAMLIYRHIKFRERYGRRYGASGSCIGGRDSERGTQ